MPDGATFGHDRASPTISDSKDELTGARPRKRSSSAIGPQIVGTDDSDGQSGNESPVSPPRIRNTTGSSIPDAMNSSPLRPGGRTLPKSSTRPGRTGLSKSKDIAHKIVSGSNQDPGQSSDQTRYRPPISSRPEMQRGSSNPTRIEKFSSDDGSALGSTDSALLMRSVSHPEGADRELQEALQVPSI